MRAVLTTLISSIIVFALTDKTSAQELLRFTAPSGTVTDYKQTTFYGAEILPFRWPESLPEPRSDGVAGPPITAQDFSSERVLEDGYVEWTAYPNQTIEGCLEQGTLRYSYQDEKVLLDREYLDELAVDFERRYASCGIEKNKATIEREIDNLLYSYGFVDRSEPRLIAAYTLPLIPGTFRRELIEDFYGSGLALLQTMTYLGAYGGQHLFQVTAYLPLQRFGLEELANTQPGDTGWTTTGPITYTETLSYLPDGRLAKNTVKLVSSEAYFVQPADGSQSVFFAARTTFLKTIERVK